MAAGFDIQAAKSTDDLAAIAGLFGAYAASISIDLTYQDFAGELAGLPGKYAPPHGALLLARDARGHAVGCVAMRPLGQGIAEMKRLYVAPEGRGLGIGRALVAATIAAARRAGHREIRLDTLPDMPAAQALYRGFGFAVIAPYYDTPVAGTIFMGLPL